MLGALAPPATPLGVGCCPIETLDFFLKFLGTFGNSLVKIRPFGLLACWPAAACCSLLLAMAQTTTNIQKCWGAWPPSHHPPWGGGCPIETLDFSEISRHPWQFPSKNQAFWPAGLLACCCLLLTAACHGPNNHQHSKMLGGLAPQPPPLLGGGCPMETPRFF